VYLGAPDYEQELKTYLPNKKVSYAEIPTAVLYRYAGLDAHYTSRLGEHLKEKLVDGIDRAYNGVLIPGVNALLKVESYGLLVDTKYLEELRAMYTVQTAALENKLERWGGSGFNPRSPQQVSEVLTKLALCPPGTGTDKEILEGLRHDFPRTLLEYRKVMKKLATYVEGITKFIEPNGRVYPSYLLHGTVTGRLSSTKPAIHTIPRDPEVRNLFIAPPGYTLLAADYDQHEWRVVAFYSGDEKLVEIFEQGRKLHGEVAEELYGKGFDHEDYMRAKMVNFGILYGRGEYSLSLQLGVSTAEAAGYIERFFERMPRVRKFLQSASATAVRTGELQTVFGRKRRFGLVSEGNYIDVKKQANNFHAQSTASDITMLSMAKLVNELPEEDARCVASIHDALLWEVRESKVSEIQNRIVEVMEAYPQELLNTTVPFKTEIKIGTRWGDLEKIK
jgi:DNA polymerase-1